MIKKLKNSALGLIAVLGLVLNMGVAVTQADPAVNGVVTSDFPSLKELESQLKILLNPNASNESKYRLIEAGEAAGPQMAVVNRVLATGGPTWWWKLIPPVTHTPTLHTAIFYQGKPGYPTDKKTYKWKRIGKEWKLSTETICAATKPYHIPCLVK